jgi:hypothetical protein
MVLYSASQAFMKSAKYFSTMKRCLSSGSALSGPPRTSAICHGCFLLCSYSTPTKNKPLRCTVCRDWAT